MDIVVDGFVHLQRYHVREVARGLAGVGNYRLREGFTSCNAVLPPPAFVVPPHDIVGVLQQPSAEVLISNMFQQIMKLLQVLFVAYFIFMYVLCYGQLPFYSVLETF